MNKINQEIEFRRNFYRRISERHLLVEDNANGIFLAE
jgi:hypothetical protein